MTFPQVMSGHERTYRPPRALREHVGAEVTAWDLFRLEHDELAGAWAHSTLTSVVAAIEAEDSGILGCTECLDTGFYGATSPDNPDLLLHLVRRIDRRQHTPTSSLITPASSVTAVRVFREIHRLGITGNSGAAQRR